MMQASHSIFRQHAHRSFTLRFRADDTERAYIRSKAPSIITNASYMVLVTTVALAVSIMLALLSVGESRTPEVEILIWTKSATQFVVVLACACACAWSWLGLHERCGGIESVEFVTVGVTIVVLVLMVLSDYFYLAKLLGYTDPNDYSTESYVLLVIDSIITATHIALPVRWVLLLGLDVVAVCLYGALAFGLGSSEPASALLHWGVLTCLITGAAIGKRNIERHERNMYVNTLEEKALRCQLEHELSDKPASRAAPRDDADDTSSQAPTTLSGRLLHEVRDGDLAGRLKRIAELGGKEEWLISGEDLRVSPQRLLGGGAFGVVVAGSFHGTAVAIKMPRNGTFFLTCIAQLANELRVLRHVRNPNIVQFHGACIDFVSGEMVLVEELVEGPCLASYVGGVGSPGKAPHDGERHRIVLGLCCGLRYLHSKKPAVVHGDLKPSNIRVELLSSGPRVKLIDFGLSRLLKGSPKPLGGTLPWMAPEVLCGGPSSERCAALPSPAADIFSLGRLLYFIATGAEPLQGYDSRALEGKAMQGEVLPQLWPADSSQFARLCAPLADRCLSRDASSRPTIRTVHEEFSRARVLPASDGGCEVELLCGDTHPSTEQVSWQEGLRRVHEAAMESPGGNRNASMSSQRCEGGTPLGWSSTRDVESATRSMTVAL